MRRSFAFKITLLALAWLVAAIACERVPAGTWWPAVFGALTVPGALALTALLALYWLRRRWRVALLPALALALCWPHVQRGLALHFGVVDEEFFLDKGLGRRDEGVTEKKVSSLPPVPPHPSSFVPNPQRVRLLSANVRIFNVYAQLRDPDFASSKAFIRWLAASPADVLCLQEFYNEPGGSHENGPVFRSAERLGAGSGRHGFVSTSLTNSVGAEFGLAIFSRFPIVRRGVIPFGKLTQNHAMWADLARPAAPGRARPDTIRVFNLHLQSMSLAEGDIVAASTTEAGLRDKAPGLLRRFRNGAVARAWQTDTVLARVRRSPYPVLLAGDFNDLPYSYPYDQLAGTLQNAWATVGLGLGATYHGRLPGLRIDQQFASAQWRVLGCRVHREILWSDHFPVEAVYQLR
ncbi:endonuclease/exonuclease/phosphatase family protein [Hymenobacter caeli]|uniref:Endonuclease/exonuclease/phosphatase family metal-dependent hydrolase n=1 Tax=Hymenobacter caeli TaxID=2735894 RepID=A0ABX2FLL0_9BACT|nr:endonuclease/exonuclease/phosphatase family protein [Hymenobacter caeli]NRT17999.1 endonuclease/exonuclease/phosphatase family metal-dependent hydrolase [Hymenobacter caeli]